MMPHHCDPPSPRRALPAIQRKHLLDVDRFVFAA
jgi:hypothetical protein